ncbi:leucine-rich repeat protein [Pseudoflavonifractor sp. MSJ-30]|uniref:leucine-rich repeat protein n=1 Tax=Pseudoflavonifractor sp. MSJ-30 TaxID=2841525 RepID=UPI00209F3B74|nr:leucine-rich repeat protein [Pseudoflavonifractor sp. MSJ-30]
MKTANVHFARVHVCQPEKVADRVEPTCTAAGKREYWRCNGCGKLYDDANCTNELTQAQLTIPKLGHDMTKTEAVDPTYWSAGNNVYYSCSRCGKIFKDEAGTRETTVENETLEKLSSIASGKFGKDNCLSWALTEDGTLTISGGGEMPDYSETVTAPWYAKRTKITAAVVEQGVTNIGNYAFNACLKLAAIDLPKGLTSIGQHAFRSCTKLKSVEVPVGVTRIGSWAFYSCSSLTSVSIPEGVMSIADYVFSGCSSLMSVSIPKGVTSIGSEAFYNCSSLTSVSIPKGVTSIGSEAFYNCSSLTSVSIPEGVTRIGDDAFQGCSGLTSVDIPESVTSMGWQVFSGCSSLTSANIPEGMSSIPAFAFNACSSLSNVRIPEGVTSIGISAFFGCSSLTSVHIPEGVTSIGNSAFAGCSSLTSVSVPEGVTSIADDTFASCSGLTSMTIPESVTSIGGSAFHGCSGLTSVRIPEGVTSIGGSAFSGCSSLTSVSIPAGVTSIGDQTFSDCSGLTSVSIPAGVTSIGEYAFSSCNSLEDVYYGGDEVAWKQISIGPDNNYLTSAYIHYAATHICTLHLIPAVVPTCTTGGNNAYYLCDACGRVYKDELGRELTTVEDETLAALGHSMTETAAKAATCIDDGNNVYYTCGNCHKVFKDEAGETETTVSAEFLPALGHAIIRVDTVAPTCTEKGNRVYYLCTTCQRAFKDKAGTEATTVAAETIPALGHSMTKTEAVAPTCTQKGNNAYYTCATCRKVYQDQAGKRETTVEAETLNALGHSMEVITATEPTCTEAGYPDYVLCTVCHKIFQDRDGKQETTLAEIAIPALGHSMEKTEAVAPTCTESGNNAYYTCSTCGKVYKDEQGNTETSAEAEVLNALGHTMEKTEAVAPTCTGKGNNAYYTCSACGKVYKDEQGNAETTAEAEVLEALGHSMEVTEAREPTCTETGNNTYWTCSTCHKVFADEQGENETSVSAETIPALGHSMVKTEAVAPTCTESGNNEYYTCSTCGKIYKDGEGNTETTAEAEVLNALGHDMEKTEAVAPTHTAGGNNAYYTCSTCGKVFQDAQGTRETTPEQEQLPRLPGIADGKCGGLTWLLSDEGVLTVSGKGRMPDYSGSALAPWYDYRDKITALEVEEGVTSIGSYAFFDCTGLTSVSLPESLTKLGRSCFSGCDSLNLLDISGLPKELTQKVTDLSGIAKLSEMVSRRVGSSAVYTWALEDSKSAPARLAGSELTVLRSGAFRLVCMEEYTGLTASAEVSAQTTSVIHPEEREQLTGGDSLTLSVWAMPFETELKARWSLDEASEAYASITEDGVLTAKAVTEPVQITVRAVPTAGEDSAEKTLWILPKTTAMGILADGHLVGDSLTIELTEKTGLTLAAQIQPQGAKAEVLWSSSRTDVAEIDEDGTVRFLKPGTTVIRAESQDGSGIAAELTLKGQYLDGAETLTLTSDMEEAGLEVGRTAKLTLSGENAIDPANVEFYVAQGTAATVDDQGLVTAGDVPGSVTIVAALKNDPLLRRAELTLQVVPTLVRALRLNAEVSQEWGYFEELDGEYSLYAEISEVAGKNRSFRLTALGSDYRDNWSEVTNLTFETSDPAVAKVSDNGTVTLTAAAAGACTVTVRCTDSLRAETQLRIIIQDRSPRLETSRLTLNSNLIAGVSTGLVDGGGNTVQSVTVYDYNKTDKAYETEPSQMFAAEAEDGTLTLRSLGAQKNGTYNVKLAASCLSGTYEFLMQVKVANSLPAVTVKQLSKFNLFYLNSTAQLSVTAKNAEVEKVELVGADSFRLDDSGELSYAETFAPGDKAVTRGTLRITLAGYQVPVEKAFTIAAVTTAPKLTTNPGSSAINLALAEPECRVSILTNGQALDLTGAEITETAAFAEMENAGSHLVFRLTENKGGTVSMTLRLPGWTQTVKLSHRITAENKLPTVKLGTAALKLNSVFTRQTASTAVFLSQGNMDLGTMTFAPTAKEGTAARAESEKIALGYDPETGALTAAIIDPDNVPKNGTYSYTFTAALADGTELKGGTVRVSVASTTPRVKLSAASVKLNRYLAGREQAVVTASMTSGTGYRLVGFEGMPAYMSFDPGTGRLTVTLPDADLTMDTCTLLPVVADETTGQEATLNTKLTFKVQTMYSDKLTLSMTAKGKLDATKPESVLTYTVNRVNNCLGAVDNVFLEGENADMFQAELDTDGAKPIVTLRTVPGQVYATNKAYKIQFRFSVCGAEVMSNVLTVKVSQTALKVTVPRTITFYLSQTAALRCNLTSNVPMESVSLNARTSKEFLEALGGEENLRFDGTRLEFRIVNPGALKAGKTYTVQLDITPENCAENVKPTLVKLTVKVKK